MPTINDQVEAGVDDADEKKIGTMDLIANKIVMGSKSQFLHSGQRFFTLISIPASATVTSATLTWRASQTDDGSFAGTMYAHDSASPGIFTTGTSDITSRTRTTASVPVTGVILTNWTLGNDYTLDVTAIVQELVDSYGGSFTAIAMLFIYTSGNGERVGASFEDSEDNAPKLQIIYTETAGSANLVAVAAVTTSADAADVTFKAGAAIVTEGAALTTSAEAPAASLFATVEGVNATLVAEIALTTTADAADATFKADATLEIDVTPATIQEADAPVAVLLAGGDGFQDFGTIQRNINRADYASGIVFFLEAVLNTDNASFSAKAKLVEVGGGDVPGSQVSTTDTTAKRVRSSSFGLAGDKTYKVQYGGDIAATYTLDSANVLWDWSD